MAATDDIGLHLKYQPKVDIVQGEVVGVEALYVGAMKRMVRFHPWNSSPLLKARLIVKIGDGFQENPANRP